jgi:uncharacterized phage-like protein YoqJ
VIVSFSGHRPPKIGGYSTPNPTYNYIVEALRTILKELKPEKALSGMALGVDQMAAEVCIELGISFDAIIPHEGQENQWPAKARERYLKLVSVAASTEIVSEGGYAAWKMQVRNQWLVDHCDLLIAVWDGSSGGTKNCIDYAITKKKRIIRIDPRKAND